MCVIPRHSGHVSNCISNEGAHGVRAVLRIILPVRNEMGEFVRNGCLSTWYPLDRVGLVR